MKKTAKRKGQAGEIVDDFFDPKTSAIFDAVTEDLNGQWMSLCATATKYAAITRDIDPKDAEAVRDFLKSSMRDYSEAVHATDGQRALLPNGDWRIVRARREHNELVAAFLYWEAAQEIKHQRELETADREAAPRRGRPKNPRGAHGYTPTPEKRLAAITIIEVLRERRAFGTSINDGAAYCLNHAGQGIPQQSKRQGDGGADYKAFNGKEKQMSRWAAFNGTTTTELRALLKDEWEAKKPSLQ